MSSLWLIRSMKGNINFADDCVSGGYIAVEWGDKAIEWNEKLQRRNRLERWFDECYPENNNAEKKRLIIDDMKLFLSIKPEDYVITPSSDNQTFYYARVIENSDYYFSEEDDCLEHRRKVQWAKEMFNRRDFLNRFGVQYHQQKRLYKLELPLHKFEAYLHEAHLINVPEFNNETLVIDQDFKTVRRNGLSVNQEEGSSLGHVSQDISQVQSPNENEDESSLEKEKVDEEEDIPPFSPEKIRIRPPISLLVDQLVARVAYKEIDLEPDFQRLRGIWKNVDKSRFIESLMLRIPIPVFYVSADQEDNWSVVDGVQRMSTICDFINNKFLLTNLEYMKQFNDYSYEDLPRSLQRRISETSLMVNVIEPSTPPEIMFNIFTRINTGGTKLNAQEIRHALNAGAVREFLKTLADSCEFKNATDNSVRPLRMEDRECVLRFLAFCITPPEEYSASTLDEFLMEAMKKINQMVCSQRTTLAKDFKKSMCAAYDIFGGHNAFRKPVEPRRYRINKALFETWSVQLARCSQEEIDKLIQKRRDVQKRFSDRLKKDVEFDDSISHSTSNYRRIRKRFQVIEEIVKEAIDAV